MIDRDNDDARGPALSLYTMRTTPYGHTMPGSAIGGFVSERWADGRRRRRPRGLIATHAPIVLAAISVGGPNSVPLYKLN